MLGSIRTVSGDKNLKKSTRGFTSRLPESRKYPQDPTVLFSPNGRGRQRDCYPGERGEDGQKPESRHQKRSILKSCVGSGRSTGTCWRAQGTVPRIASSPLRAEHLRVNGCVWIRVTLLHSRNGYNLVYRLSFDETENCEKLTPRKRGIWRFPGCGVGLAWR